jgi:hypothetical protein
MNYKTAFGSYLKHEDLQGKAVRLTIEEVANEEIKGDHGVEKKLCVKFAGKDKGLILNRTNADSIAEIAQSEDTDDWCGHQIVLYPDKTKFGGKTVDCIRIRAAANGAVRQAPPPPPEPVGELTDDDIPF